MCPELCGADARACRGKTDLKCAVCGSSCKDDEGRRAAVSAFVLLSKHTASSRQSGAYLGAAMM